MTLRISRGAEEDLAGAIGWYDEQRDGLGYEFHDAVYDLLETIEASPRRFPLIQGRNADHEIRHAQLGRFPYRLVFQIKSDQSMVVLAVAHTRRHPDYWHRRNEE